MEIWICCSCQPNLGTYTSPNSCVLQLRGFCSWCLNISRYSSHLSTSPQCVIFLYFHDYILLSRKFTNVPIHLSLLLQYDYYFLLFSHPPLNIHVSCLHVFWRLIWRRKNVILSLDLVKKSPFIKIFKIFISKTFYNHLNAVFGKGNN